MFAAGKPGFLSTEDLVLVLAGMNSLKVQDPGDGITRIRQNDDAVTDTLAVVAVRPNGTDYPLAITPVFVATTKSWLVTIPAADYMAGRWIFWAISSSDIYGPRQHCVAHWGDTWAQLLAAAISSAADAATAVTAAGTAATKADDAKTAANTAATKADDAKTAANTAATKADDAKTAALVASSQATLARQAGINRLKVDTTAKTQILYADDGTTPLKTWHLTDETGAATATRIFERGTPT